MYIPPGGPPPGPPSKSKPRTGEDMGWLQDTGVPGFEPIGRGEFIIPAPTGLDIGNEVAGECGWPGDAPGGGGFPPG